MFSGDTFRKLRLDYGISLLLSLGNLHAKPIANQCRISHFILLYPPFAAPQAQQALARFGPTSCKGCCV